VFADAALAVFLVSLDSTVAIAAFPAWRSAFADSTPQALSWALNAYTIVYAALLVPAGRLGDRRGHLPVFRFGVALFGAASLACALAQQPAALIAARTVQAIGGALLTPTSLALILAAFPASRRAVAVSLWGAVGALAAAVGPAAGAAIVDTAGWPWVFGINLPVVAWALWRSRPNGPAALGLPAATTRSRRIDWLGSAWLALAVGLIVLALVQAQAWPPPWSLACAASGLLLLGAFASAARGRADAALDLRLFDEPSYRWVNAATLVFGTAFSLMFLGSFLFLHEVWGYTLARAGLALTPGPLAVIPTAIAAGRLAARVGHRPLLLSGGLLFAASQALLLARAGDAADYLGVWLPSALATGVAVGLTLPALAGAAVAKLAAHDFGTGNAVNAAIRQTGAAFGAALAVLLAGGAGAGLAAFQTIFAALVGLGLLTALLGARVDTRPPAAAATGRPAAATPAQ
jgi:MFS family permease